MSRQSRRLKICNTTFIPIKEVAEILGCTTVSLSTKKKKGDLPFEVIRINGGDFVHEDNLRRYLKSLGVEPNF